MSLNAMTPPQQRVLSAGLLESGFPCLLQMPTGSGKTFLAEWAIQHTLDAGKRAIYVAPLRALAEELRERWTKRFGSGVGVFTGDYSTFGKTPPVSFSEARLLIVTPERLDVITRHWRHHWHWIPEVDLLVVDEFHLLGDARRGGRLEGGLLRFQRLNPFARVLGLSATLGNRGELADWLQGIEFHSDWRPVPLTWRIERYRKATEKPELLRTVVAENVAAGGQSLVFVHSRRRAEELARTLAAGGLCCRHHHAGLAYDQRRQIEGELRSGACQVLVATSTLEMGINLPVRQVVLYDLQSFKGGDFVPISTNSVWQRVGRAGRPGQDSTGEAVLLAAQWDRDAERHEAGVFEPIRSALADERMLAEQIVAEVASGMARTPSQLQRVFERSLAAHQKALPSVLRVLHKLCAAGMIDEVLTDDKRLLKATAMGRTASRHLLAPDTVLACRRIATELPQASFFDLLLVLCATPDAEPVLPVDFEDLDTLAEALRTEPSYLLTREPAALMGLVPVRGKRLLSALLMARVLQEWTTSGNADHVAERFGCYPFEVSRLTESVVRLLTALRALTTPDDPAQVAFARRVRLLQAMVQVGMDSEAATLTYVPGIGPELARRLYGAGIGSLEALAESIVVDLAGVRGVSAKRAAQWIAAAQEVLPTLPILTELPPTTLQVVADWPMEIDPYRLRRSLDLSVSGGLEGSYTVTGGTEPHQVWREKRTLVCDCPDHAKGHLCKHILAVQRKRGDASVSQLVKRLEKGEGMGWNLFDLWWDGAKGGKA